MSSRGQGLYAGAEDKVRVTAALRPSERLRSKIDLASPGFITACGRLFTHPRLREILPEYLAANHAVIRATVPLMELTRDRAAAMADSDPVAAGVVGYLDEHIAEELGHDDWLLEDLELLGVEASGVLTRVPSPTVAALVGSQYYWTLHVHPVAILGYLAFMEGFPPSTRLIDDLVARTGYPRRAFRTLAEHGELDPTHREDMDRLIDALPLTRQQEILLGIAAISGIDSLARFVKEILEGFAVDESDP